ncbi:hypothetical protein BD324DRAFT_663180 [Kockovaella imperatae]|uniref:DUF7923 domain-containing protein n=1 Tax=Kockovaella imperatae TaxID=4999 RepID=A0A1Y1UCM5_9TREE|nr:hypothetical protein BD324DRAFT_663180 [Kockovaella imperatae]ORX34815.1 hypothetical protein BD324DRAFT_663180 [Kockovaella imperatae]
MPSSATYQISPHGPIGSPAQPAFSTTSWSSTHPPNIGLPPKSPHGDVTAGDQEVEEIANFLARARLWKKSQQGQSVTPAAHPSRSTESDHYSNPSGHSHSPLLPNDNIWSNDNGDGNGAGTTSVKGNQTKLALSMLDRLTEWESNKPLSAPPPRELDETARPDRTSVESREEYHHLPPLYPSSLPVGSSRPFPLPSPQFSSKTVGAPVDPASQVTHHLESLKHLFEPLVGAVQDMEGLKKELTFWKREWATADKEAKRLAAVLESTEDKVPAGGRFTAVLLDGDGLIFADHLLKQGFPGGQKAAHMLLSALPKLIAHAKMARGNAHEAPPDLTVDAKGLIVAEGEEGHQEAIETKELGSVVVQLFLNKSGFGNILVKNGSVASWGMYEAFLQGFSAAHELFTVIDVGTGKEASDAKIRDFLKLYVKNAQCESVILGASHDNGYATTLSSLQTESLLSKLLLLKGYSDLAPQLRQHSSRVVSIPSLFRTSRIALSPQTFSTVTQRSESSVVALNVPKTLVTDSISEESDSISDSDSEEILEWSDAPRNLRHTAQIGLAKSSTKSSAFKKSRSARDKVNEASTKSGSSKASVLENIVSEDEWKVAKKANKKSGQKANSGDRRAAEKSIRTLVPRPCHAYYLSNAGCGSGHACAYGHDYDLSEDQVAELAKLTKALLCPYIKYDKCQFVA